MAAFSLLIATVNRAEPLRRLLASLEEQSYHDFEILIADQNPPGFLDELYAEFQNTLPLRVITVPDKGVSQARNALLPHAQGQLVAFPDDDCWYEPETLEQAVAFFAANPHVHAVLGQWHDPAGSIRLQASGRAINRFSAFRRGGTLVQFYRKAVVDAVGGFDPELGPGTGTGLPYGCGEDTDYVLRALAAGFAVVFTPSVRVCHPEVSLTSFSPEKIRSYALGRMHLLRKHNLPLWFKLVNIAYPLLRAPLEGRKAWPYRKAMFFGRLAGFFDGWKKNMRENSCVSP